MSKKISFTEFKGAVDNRILPADKIGDYVELDPASPIPKLIFKADALTDDAPNDYDVDEEIYQLTQHYKDNEFEKDRIFNSQEVTRSSRGSTTRGVARSAPLQNRVVVAEGDSWFNLPPLIRPTAIADRIWWNRSYNIKNIARWGHTLKTILHQGQHLRTLEHYKPAYFLLSAGGNDLQQGLASGTFLHAYDPRRPVHDYLTDQAKQDFDEIADNYRTLLNQVSSKFPDTKTITYGYDYPRPLVGNGRYIGQFLHKQGFPREIMTELVRPSMEELNNRIRSVSLEFQNITFLNCLNVTNDFTWYDDMHPSSEGFVALTRKFEETMR